MGETVGDTSLKAPTCIKCGRRMRLSHLMPKFAGIPDLLVFDCDLCKHTVSIAVHDDQRRTIQTPEGNSREEDATSLVPRIQRPLG